MEKNIRLSLPSYVSFTREFMKYCWDGMVLTLAACLGMPETQTQSPRVLINLLSMK